jgi:hypothetical protein
MNPTTRISFAPMLFRHMIYPFISELFHKIPIINTKVVTTVNVKKQFGWSSLIFSGKFYHLTEVSSRL